MRARPLQPARLDIPAFTQEEASLEGSLGPAETARLRASEYAAPDEAPVLKWHATGALRPVTAGPAERWMTLHIEGTVPLVCQRCLEPMRHVVDETRHLRFVESEALAEELDADSDDDVLATSIAFDLPALVEDEVLLSLPIVPRHERCPSAAPIPSSDEPASADSAPHPFAQLAALKGRLKPGS